MSNTKFRIVFVIVSLAFIWAVTQIQILKVKIDKQAIELSNNNKQIDSLKNYSDSLNMELLPAQIELGRFQVAYEIFSERNPRAASQYGTIISEETE